MFRLITLLFIGVLANAHEKCKVTDEVCMGKLSNEVFTGIFSGSDELDPMRHDAIEGNLSLLKYRLSDTTVTGFKNCKLDTAKFLFKRNAETDERIWMEFSIPIDDVGANFVKLSFDVTVLCPALLMKGNYNLNGQLLTLPVEGSGNFTVQTKKYRLEIHMDIETHSNDGKSYMHVKSFGINAEPLEPVEFNFDNLFNGNKELAESALKYANENWIQVAKAVQEPVFQADLNKIIKVANRHLKKNALEDYIVLQ